MTKKNWFLMLIIASVQLASCKASGQMAEKSGYVPPEPSTTKLSENLILHENIRYGAIPDSIDSPTSDRILDVYLPQTNQGAAASLPVYLFIHGGGFTGGDKNVRDICSKIASKGFAVVSINYRLTLKYNKVAGASCSANMSGGLPPDKTFHPMLQRAVRNASEDAAMALGWIKNNAGKYRFDLTKVAVSGGSAGAMTALHLAYVSDQQVIPMKAVVDFWGGLEDASVIEKGAAPILIYHGDLDSTINIAYAYALKQRMDKIGSGKSQLKVFNAS